jgi:hypothetical protein
MSCQAIDESTLCQAIKNNGEPCTREAKEEYGFLYCKKHKKWLDNEEEENMDCENLAQTQVIVKKQTETITSEKSTSTSTISEKISVKEKAKEAPVATKKQCEEEPEILEEEPEEPEPEDDTMCDIDGDIAMEGNGPSKHDNVLVVKLMSFYYKKYVNTSKPSRNIQDIKDKIETMLYDDNSVILKNIKNSGYNCDIFRKLVADLSGGLLVREKAQITLDVETMIVGY